jgi:tetratricopeptide (TPR) repeat protein
MQSKLSRICDALIEAGWLAALIVTPLFFNTSSNRVFEPDKLHLLRSIALLTAVVWLVQLLDGWRGLAGGPGVWQRIKDTPLVLPTLILVFCYLLSTALSVVPRISLLGSYVRLQGTFTYVSYVVMFFVILTHLRTRAQVNRIFYTVILTSLPISIYAMIQHMGIDPLPWGGNVTDRVAANMGNAIFVAAYLIMAVFLTLERLVNSLVAVLNNETGTTADALRAGSYVFVLIVQLVAIVFTQSRGPWIGLAVGLYVFGMLGILLVARWSEGRSRLTTWLSHAVRPVWATLIGLTIAGVAFLVVFNLPNTPLKSLRQVRYVGRLGTLFSTTDGTNAVRVLIWQGVVDMMLEPHPPIATPNGAPDKLNAIRPLVGYGPESMWVAYNRFYPPDLAHYEARNASPDRSHNETFDTLVRTGAIGFAAQLLLYGSIFFYSLRWLGLIRNRARRNLFIAMLVAGGVLGVLVPALADHSLRLAGIGLPAGLIVGFILYVTVDLLSARPADKASADTPAAANGHDGQGTVAPHLVRPSLEQQLIILALFAAIVAHFTEIHFGIAIAATLTHFWILSAVLVVTGLGWLDKTETVAAVATAAAALRSAASQPARVAAVATAAPGGAAGAGSRAKPSTKDPVLARRDTPPARMSSKARPRTVQPAARDATPYAILPYAGIIMLITLVLVWDYLVNQAAAANPLAMLWAAFTTRVIGSTGTVVAAPMLAVLVLFTWLIGILAALAETRRMQPSNRSYDWTRNALICTGVALGAFLVYGLIQAGRLQYDGLQVLDIFRRQANNIVLFDGVLLLVMLGVAAGVWLADGRARPTATFCTGPALPLVGALALTPLAFFLIADLNIQIVQADTYYKSGLAYEGRGQWESAVVLYNEAVKIEPKEDYYYLFLGRAMLEYASSGQPGAAKLPANLSGFTIQELQQTINAGLQSTNREDLMRATYAALLAAQQLNPLNTDHTANLARLYRAWAFSNTQNPTQAFSNQQLRQLTIDQPSTVDMTKLQKSLQYYKEATDLSPQNAQLFNEMSSVQFIMGDLPGAKASLERSLALDKRFSQTYPLLGDLLAEMGDKPGAAEAYKQAALMTPNDISVLGALGVYAAQAGDIQTAVSSFDKIISLESTTLAGVQSALAALNAQAQQAGGYDKLGASAQTRQQQLQSSIGSYTGQLEMSYRNKALVLRDAGRTDEALSAAKSALQMATDADKPAVQQLIDELQKKISG